MEKVIERLQQQVDRLRDPRHPWPEHQVAIIGLELAIVILKSEFGNIDRYKS